MEDASILLAWAKLHGIIIHPNVSINTTAHAGLGILAKHKSEITTPLISVPRSLILTASNVRVFALSFANTLKQLLKIDNDEPLAPREVLLRFLLFSFKSPTVNSNFYTPYISVLPDPTKLVPKPPTFWSDEEVEKLRGTSLLSPLQAKRRKLAIEYDRFERKWREIMKTSISFEEYKRADFLVTSRVMEIDGEIGIVPVLDFANHSSYFNARYEITEDEVELVWADDFSLTETADVEEEEVAITYGLDKGSAEILFNYGFLISEDEITRESIKMLVQRAPGLAAVYGRPAIAELTVELTDENVKTSYECGLLWLLCLNEEDGFRITLPQVVDADTDVRAEVSIRGKSLNLKGEDLVDAIRSAYDNDEKMRDVYELRRVAILESWVTDWIDRLADSEIAHHRVPEDPITDVSDERAEPSNEEQSSDAIDGIAESLRQREQNVLMMVLQELSKSQLQLMQLDTVKTYLRSQEEHESSEEAEPRVESNLEESLM